MTHVRVVHTYFFYVQYIITTQSGILHNRVVLLVMGGLLLLLQCILYIYIYMYITQIILHRERITRNDFCVCLIGACACLETRRKYYIVLLLLQYISYYTQRISSLVGSIYTATPLTNHRQTTQNRLIGRRRSRPSIHRHLFFCLRR